MMRTLSLPRRVWRSAEWELLFHALPRSDRRGAIAWHVLAVVRALLPAALVIATGVLAGAVESHTAVTASVVAVILTFLAIQVLSPLHRSLSTNLGARVAFWLHGRLMTAAAGPPGIAHLERPELMDDFSLARDFDLGITAPPIQVSMPFIADGLVEMGSGIALALVLFSYQWWAPLVIIGSWGASHVLLRSSTVFLNWRSDEVIENQRNADYAYRMAVDAPDAKELRVFGLADWTVGRFGSRRRRLLELSLEGMRLRQRPLIWALSVIAAGNGLVFASLGLDAAAGRIGLGSIVVYAGAATGAAVIGVNEFDWWLNSAARPVPVVRSLEDKMPQFAQLADGCVSAAGLPRREIRLRDVCFSYESGQPVFQHLDLTIPAGKSMAIVGINGAGKTTLAKLLCRFYDPQDGSIEVDGTDLRSLDLPAWRSRVTGVFQDFIRYELPLRDNVAPNGAAADEDVAWALHELGIGGVAELATVMSRALAEGSDLSGGQWQRVALARALFAVRNGAGVVILDEPTAQLDVRGEAEIFEAILDATRGRTTIIISHRFSTVRHADQICVLESGRVAELGSHDKLMAENGRYRKMFDLQAARFVE
jgi:ATP-binding cassette, subfamily B, bacterial